MNNSRLCPECGRPLPPDAPGGICPLCLIKRGLETPKVSRTPLGRDRNLLFGVLAIQLGIVTPERFVEAAAAWATSPDKTLAERLLDSGALAERQRELIDRFVEEAVRHHGGSAEDAYTSMGGDAFVSSVVAAELTPEMGKAFTTHLGIPLGVNDAEDPEGVKALTETPGRYSRGSEYSRGGMGRVLVVHDEYLAREVALKELAPFSKDDKTTPATPVRASTALVARFLREARVTGQLEHPAIVPVYELGRRADGTYYYTMKLVRGQTLRKCIAEAKTLDGRLALLPHFVDLCNAVAYAHSRGVIHRDLKPDNVMVGSFGETVLIDWGLAKVLGRRDEHEEELRKTLSEIKGKDVGELKRTETGVRMGTPHYMAPEQAEGRIHQLDERSDVFSLGVMLYELLTGKLPFDGKTTDELIERLIYDPAAPIASIEPDAPSELVSIVTRALQKKPNDRYQSALELAEEIERFQTGAMVKSYRYSLREMFGRYYRRHRAVVRTALAAAGIILITGIVSYINVVRARDAAIIAKEREEVARDQAERDNYVAEIRLAQAYVDDNNYRAAKGTLWGTQPERRNFEWGYLLNLCSQDLYTIEGPTHAALSPDGTVFATYSATTTLTFYNAADGTQIAEIPNLVRGMGWGEFRPGTSIFTGAMNDGRLRSWDAKTGEEVWSVQAAEDSLLQVIYSSDGNRILSLSLSGTHGVWDCSVNPPVELARFNRPAQGGVVIDSSSKGPPFLANGIAISYNGLWVLTGQSDNRTRIGRFDTYAIDASGARVVASLDGFSGEFRPGADEVAIVSGDEVVLYTLNAAGGAQEIRRLARQRSPISALVFNADGTQLACGSDDGTITVWTLGDPSPPVETKAPASQASVVRMAYSADGDRLVVTDTDLRIHIFDGKTGDCLNTLRGHSRAIGALNVSPDGRQVLTGGDDSTVKMWDTGRPLGQSILFQARSAVQKLAVSSDGSVLAVAATGGRIDIVDSATGSARVGWAAFNPAERPTAASLDTRANRMAAVLDSFTPVVIDLSTNSVLSSFRGHDGEVESVALSPDAKRVVTASKDFTARVWEADTGAELFPLTGHAGVVYSAVFSPDGSRIVTGSHDKTVRLWDATTGVELRTIAAHDAEVTRAVFMPNGVQVMSAGEDRTLKLWDAASGELVRNYSGYQSSAGDFAVSPAGDRFVTAPYFGRGVIADAREGGALASLAEPPLGMKSIVFSPDGFRTFTGDSDGRVWQSEAFSWRIGADEHASSEADYEAYRRQRVQADPQAVSASVAREFVLTTEAVLRDSFARLRGVIEASDGSAVIGTDGLLLAQGPAWNAVARLMFQPGDRLQTAAGTAATDPSSALTGIDRFLAGINATSVPEITVLRHGGSQTISFVLLPVTNEQRVVEVERDDAVRRFRAARAGYRLTARTLHEINDVFLRAAGLSLEGANDLNGFLVAYAPGSPDETQYRSSGLTDNDRVVNINGQPITSISGRIAEYDRAINAIEGGQPYETTYDVERGSFRKLAVTIRVPAGV